MAELSGYFAHGIARVIKTRPINMQRAARSSGWQVEHETPEGSKRQGDGGGSVDALQRHAQRFAGTTASGHAPVLIRVST
jgi:hypothetical protein